MITKDFVLAGRALFTVSNGKGTRYTYRVNLKPGDDRYPAQWFVKLLTGPDNTDDRNCYTYIGKVLADGKVKMTAASKYTEDSLPVKVLGWALGIIFRGGSLPEGYAIHHEGRCARCGAVLTVPSSITSGFGPECVKHVNQPIMASVQAWVAQYERKTRGLVSGPGGGVMTSRGFSTGD